MADERVPAVVDRQISVPIPAEDPAGGVKPSPKDVAVERLADRGSPERADERVVAPGAQVVSDVEPGREVGQGPGVPPKRHTTRTARGDLPNGG